MHRSTSRTQRIFSRTTQPGSPGDDDGGYRCAGLTTVRRNLGDLHCRSHPGGRSRLHSIQGWQHQPWRSQAVFGWTRLDLDNCSFGGQPFRSRPCSLRRTAAPTCRQRRQLFPTWSSRILIGGRHDDHVGGQPRLDGHGRHLGDLYRLGLTDRSRIGAAHGWFDSPRGAPQTVAAGLASVSTSSLAVGSHSLTAVFTPADLAAFSGSTSAALPYTITPAPATATSTSLAASPASMAGAGHHRDVHGHGQSDGGRGLGAVQGWIGRSGCSSGCFRRTSIVPDQLADRHQPRRSGQSSPRRIQARICASTAPPLTYGVIASTGAATTTTLAANPSSPAAFGAAVTFTATVSPAVGGTIQFEDGSTALGTPQTVSGGQATLSSSTLAVGSHSVTALFSPADAGANAASTSAAVTYVVTRLPRTT